MNEKMEVSDSKVSKVFNLLCARVSFSVYIDVIIKICRIEKGIKQGFE